MWCLMLQLNNVLFLILLFLALNYDFFVFLDRFDVLMLKIIFKKNIILIYLQSKNI